VTSVHHRGSALRPGLVLGLDQGGVCEGVAYRVAAADAAGVLAYLRAREQVNGVYREAFVPIEIEAERHEIVQAVTYLVERAHPSYSGRLPLVIQARIIRGARGLSGANVDYVINTLAHMAAMGIRERELERLLVVLGAFFSRDETGRGSSLRARRCCDGRRLVVASCPATRGVCAGSNAGDSSIAKKSAEDGLSDERGLRSVVTGSVVNE
jgi:cation transport protein ChaC